TTATLTCGAGDWNDDTSCAICSELTGMEITWQCGDYPSIYAPYTDGSVCRYRLGASQTCSSAQPSLSRICKCE
ncbi:hypothetical protein KJ742_02105, partial [Patescibacteria group bacterium]|nr:hypothetical protein [Patescibacteria group bacterium]